MWWKKTCVLGKSLSTQYRTTVTTYMAGKNIVVSSVILFSVGHQDLNLIIFDQWLTIGGYFDISWFSTAKWWSGSWSPQHFEATPWEIVWGELRWVEICRGIGDAVPTATSLPIPSPWWRDPTVWSSQIGHQIGQSWSSKASKMIKMCSISGFHVSIYPRQFPKCQFSIISHRNNIESSMQHVSSRITSHSFPVSISIISHTVS